MRSLAAIDVGSNAVRLLMVRLSAAGVLVESRFQRYALRLGTDVFAHGRVGEERIAALVDVFTDVARRLKRHGVEQYRAVATSAMRDAKNRDTVLRRIKRKTGLTLEVISGVEEARLSRDALMHSLGWVPPGTLLVDLGGGSLEVQRAASALGRSLPFGTVRLMRKYPALEQILDRRQVQTMSRWIRRDLERRLSGAPTALAVGTGGNFDALARLVAVRGALYPGIDVRRLPAFATRLGKMSAAQRVRRFALRPDRADVILPAVMVIQALVRIFDIQRFVVPGTGLRDGVLYRLAAASIPQVRSDGRRAGKRSTARLVRLADRLFALLAPVHRLWPPARVPLRVAAQLSYLKDPRVLGQEGRAAGVDDPVWRVTLQVMASSRDGRPVAKSLARVDRRAAEILSALLALAAVLAERGVDDLEADLLGPTLLLRAGLQKPVPSRVLARLTRALGKKIRVR